MTSGEPAGGTWGRMFIEETCASRERNGQLQVLGQVARQTRPEGASGARRTWVYVERRWRPRTWRFELSGTAARRGLNKFGDANWPSTPGSGLGRGLRHRQGFERLERAEPLLERRADVQRAALAFLAPDRGLVHGAERVGEAPARRRIAHVAQDLHGAPVGRELLLAREGAHHQRVDHEIE